MAAVWEDWAGQVVDEFTLVQHLGSSSSSAVYLTNRRTNGVAHKAVIKLIDARSPGADLRFSRWQSAVQLSHPHLIRLFAAGRFELSGTPLFYAVMEYADENLSQLLPARPLTPTEARDMLEPVLEALAYLHKQGFVQGDLRPGNIMAINDQLKLAADSVYRIGDRVQARSGSNPYQAPESAQSGISPAADVWALGVTLVEALTQTAPSRRAPGANEPVLPQMLPEVFHDIARHCLVVDPAQRWTVADISARLSPTAPVRNALMPPQTVQPQRPFDRRWLAAAGAVLALIILLLWLAVRKSPETGRSQSANSEAARPGVQVTEKPRPPAEAAPQKPSPLVGQRPTGQEDENSNSASPGTAPEPPNATRGTSQPGADPEIVHEVIPSVPRSARETITGRVKVRVKVNVDSEGKVSNAELVDPGPSKYFARLAMQAAQGWRFQPSQDASRDWVLRFEFGRGGTTVHPSRSSR